MRLAGLLQIPFRAAAGMLLLCVAPSVGNAQTTIYSTFGPGDFYDFPGYGIITNDFPQSQPQSLAAGFVFGGSTGDLLFGIRFPGADNGRGGLVVRFLVGDSVEVASVLDSWLLPPTGTPDVNQIFSLTSVNRPALTFGLTYWVQLSPEAPSGQIGWEWWSGGQGRFGDPLEYSSNGGSTWNACFGCDTPAFDVTVISPGIVTPEPATVTLLATGLAGMAAARRKRRKV